MRYTPSDGRILVQLKAEMEQANLVISDSGIGISAQMLPRIFDLFVQGDRGIDRGQGGLGIGLTLVKRLVELHGGSVHAASPGPGLGSTFTVRYPRTPAPLLSMPKRSAFKGGRRVRVLLVEDNDGSRVTLRTVLQLAAHEVVEEVNGVDGLNTALATKPEVVVLDIGLPRMSGYEVAMRIREHSADRSMQTGCSMKSSP